MFALGFAFLQGSVPYKRKKVRNFFRHFCTEILQIPGFFSRQKPAFLFPAKNRRQLRFTAPRSGILQKSRRKVAELRRRTFFFFGDQHKIGEKDACIGVMTFFFFEITLKPHKIDEKIFSIFTLTLERSHYFRHFRRR